MDTKQILKIDYLVKIYIKDYWQEVKKEIEKL